MKKLLSIIVMSLFTACAGTPPTHFYVLEALNQPAPNVSGSQKHLIGIGPLTLPNLLERKQIVTRNNNAIQLSEFQQWAEPLKDNILAVLTKNIAAKQPTALVKAFPWAAYGEVNYRVIIDISRFDSELGKSAQLEASWAIMQEKDHSIIKSGQTHLTKSLPDANYASVILAMNQLLAEFSEQVSLALSGINT